MCDKNFFINKYFKKWDNDIKKASEILSNQHYYLEGILVLSCYIGAFAAIRFPCLKDGEAYVKVILEYSGMRDFFEQIDLLFLYQWPRSKLCNKGKYKYLKNYDEIVSKLELIYGAEDNIKEKSRYISPSELTNQLLGASISGFDENNFRKNITLFSLSELLYLYIRCDAVHNNEFTFINEKIDCHGNLTYENNHAITGQVLLETTQNVHKELWNECYSKSKWPCEL